VNHPKIRPQTWQHKGLCVARQEQNFRAEVGAGIGIKLAEWKHRFIKNDVTGYIDTTDSNI
jgi:hypothetical protein